MAGSNPNFNPRGFREGIRFAMEMGAPPDSEHRLTFHFPSTLVYTASVDGLEVPFDPNATVQRTETPPVTVPAAVEYYDDEGLITSFGVVQPTRIKVTLLDEDYAKVKGCSHVVAGGDTYHYRRMEPPSGLFDVGLFVLHFAAEQET